MYQILVLHLEISNGASLSGGEKLTWEFRKVHKLEVKMKGFPLQLKF